jgi:adenylate cyclase
MEQRRAAIIYAEVVGHGRLTSIDEEGTHRTLGTYLDIWSEIVERHQGRSVVLAGTTVLAEVSAAQEALRCAVEAQRTFKKRNADLPVDRWLRFRVGLNVGPVMVDRTDIYGEAVDVAARLAGRADAGGICVSEAVFSEANNKLDLRFEPLGELRARNITNPIAIYRVGLGPENAGRIARRPPPSMASSIGAAFIVVVGMFAVTALLSAWLRPDIADFEPAAGLASLPPMLEKPSIAVLAFENLANESERFHLEAGLTDSVVTSLAKFPNLAVSGPQSSPHVAERSPETMSELAEQMHVRYLLRGSVHQSSDRVRVTVKLFDTSGGTYVWGGRYDAARGEVFASDKGIADSIAAGLWTKLTQSADTGAFRSETTSAEAYRLAVLGFEHYRRFTPADNTEAKYYFRTATNLDPEFLGGWSALGWSYFNEARYGWSETPGESLARASKLAHKVLSIDPSHTEARALLDRIQASKGQVNQIVY